MNLCIRLHRPRFSWLHIPSKVWRESLALTWLHGRGGSCTAPARGIHCHKCSRTGHHYSTPLATPCTATQTRHSWGALDSRRRRSLWATSLSTDMCLTRPTTGPTANGLFRAVCRATPVARITPTRRRCIPTSSSSQCHGTGRLSKPRQRACNTSSQRHSTENTDHSALCSEGARPPPS